MKTYLSAVLMFLLSVNLFSQDNKITKDSLITLEQKVSYSIGQDIGTNFKMQGIDIITDILSQGVKDAMADTSLLTEDEMNAVLNEFQQIVAQKQEAKRKVEAEINIKEGDDFFAQNKTKEGVVTLPSGLQYKVITKAEGPKPADTSKVTVHYRGYFIDGKEFDSSIKRNQPATFPVKGVIKGWTEALMLMSVGEKWELYIPYQLAYGEFGKQPVIPPAKALLFEVELISIDGK
ncbi:MAG: FKBP-type peptidyl-prolyl cis-trans isomerase [bacterium]